MKKEVDCAVETFHRIAFGIKKNGNKFISESKLSCFISVLTELLFARYEQNWYPENPDRGSGYRCIRVNTQCIDPTIVESLKKADISPDQMVGTSELTVWVDPGVVSVRIGEDGSIGMEVVDEEVHRMGKTRSSVKLEKSGSVETDSSSRSSSPELDRSQSSSPNFSLSHLSRSSPPMEYNPYCPPARVNYPMRFQRRPSPPVPSSPPNTTMSSPPPKSVSAHQGYPSPMAAARASHIPPFSGSPVSFSVADSCSRTAQGFIPVSHGMAGYTRPRAIFPSHYSEQNMEKLPSKATYVPYSVPLSSAHNMPSPNFYDIPAMA